LTWTERAVRTPARGRRRGPAPARGPGPGRFRGICIIPWDLPRDTTQGRFEFRFPPIFKCLDRGRHLSCSAPRSRCR